MTAEPDQAGREVLRAVLLRSELIPPMQVAPLIAEIMSALRAAELRIQSSRPRHDWSASTAQLDMLVRQGR